MIKVKYDWNPTKHDPCEIVLALLDSFIILLLICVIYSPYVSTSWYWLHYLLSRPTHMFIACGCLYFYIYIWLSLLIECLVWNKVAMVETFSNRIYAWYPWVWFVQNGVKSYPLRKESWSLSNRVHSWHPCLQLASKDVPVDFIQVSWGVGRYQSRNKLFKKKRKKKEENE